MAGFEQKLVFLMESHGFSNMDVARGMSFSHSTVSRWRSGKRAFDRKAHGMELATFFVRNVDAAWLCDVLGIPGGAQPMAPALLCERVEQFFFDGRDLDLTIASGKDRAKIGRPVANQGCFLGVQGLFDALSLLAQRAQELADGEVLVYLSSERCNLLFDPAACELWDYLHTLNHERPLKVAIEQGQDPSGADGVVERLLPFIRSGRIELGLIPSSEHFFCYNISIVLDNVCMVIATEPAGVGSASVAMFVESPEFVLPMGKVLHSIRALARPLAQRVQTPRAESVAFERLFGSVGAVGACLDGIDPVYLGVDGFKALLKSQGLTYEKARYHVERFVARKAAFEHFLDDNEYRVVVSLEAIDDSIEGGAVSLSELCFPAAAATITVEPGLLRGYLEGMVGYLERFGNLHVVLGGRAAVPGVAWRLKEGRFLLLHDFEQGDKVCLCSEDRLLTGQFARLFEEAYHNRDAIDSTRDVVAALRKRVERLERENPGLQAQVQTQVPAGGGPARMTGSEGEGDDGPANGKDDEMDRVAERIAQSEARLEVSLDKLARAIHEDYYRKSLERGQQGPFVRPWEQLPREIQEDNRRQVHLLARKLNTIGCGFDAGEARATTVMAFTDDEINMLARLEHYMWLAAKGAAGYLYGEERNDDRCKVDDAGATIPLTHPDMLPWEQLTEEARAKDVDTAHAIIPLLAGVGLRVYRTL